MSDLGADDLRLEGDLTTTPRGIVVTVLATIFGIAFVRGAARWIGRLAFGYRKPARVLLSARGLEISYRVELLGRKLSERETIVPLSNLASISRETRFSRLGLHAGLLALALGTYVGVGLLVDGLRVEGGSPSLLGLGLLFVAIGIVLDYGLSTAIAARRQTCRLVVLLREGPGLCVEGLKPEAVDAVLARLSSSLGSPAATGERATAAPS